MILKQIEKEYNSKATTVSDPEILTPEVIDAYLDGVEIPKLQQVINSYVEYDILEYFRTNNFLLVDSDIKLYLTSYYRSNNPQDLYLLELDPNYNILFNELPADAEYYFNTNSYKYTPYYNDEGDETLDFLTWTILQLTAEGSNWKTEINDADILQAIKQQDKRQQQIIRTANYIELFNDIKTTYKKIIKELLTEADRNLGEIFFEEIIIPAQDAALEYITQEHTGTPFTELI